MAVSGAVIAYVFQLISFILLRLRHPDMPRPWRNPLGVTGAVVTCVIALVALGALLMNPDYQPGVFGAAIWFLCGIGWFWRRRRSALVFAPEERFAEELGGAIHEARNR